MGLMLCPLEFLIVRTVITLHNLFQDDLEALGKARKNASSFSQVITVIKHIGNHPNHQITSSFSMNIETPNPEFIFLLIG